MEFLILIDMKSVNIVFEVKTKDLVSAAELPDGISMKLKHNNFVTI